MNAKQTIKQAEILARADDHGHRCGSYSFVAGGRTYKTVHGAGMHWTCDGARISRKNVEIQLSALIG